MDGKLENYFVRFWFENGILISNFKDGTVLDLEKIKEAIDIREKISEGKNQFWLYDISNLKNVTKEVRDYAEEHGQNYLAATAVLVNSHVAKFIFNAYLKLNKPQIPFLFFTKKENAISWLLDIKEKNSNCS